MDKKQIDTDDEQMNCHSVLNQMINNYSDVYKIPCDHQLFPKWLQVKRENFDTIATSVQCVFDIHTISLRRSLRSIYTDDIIVRSRCGFFVCALCRIVCACRYTFLWNVLNYCYNSLAVHVYTLMKANVVHIVLLSKMLCNEIRWSQLSVNFCWTQVAFESNNSGLRSPPLQIRSSWWLVPWMLLLWYLHHHLRPRKCRWDHCR